MRKIKPIYEQLKLYIPNQNLSKEEKNEYIKEVLGKLSKNEQLLLEKRENNYDELTDDEKNCLRSLLIKLKKMTANPNYTSRGSYKLNKLVHYSKEEKNAVYTPINLLLRKYVPNQNLTDEEKDEIINEHIKRLSKEDQMLIEKRENNYDKLTTEELKRLNGSVIRFLKILIEKNFKENKRNIFSLFKNHTKEEIYIAISKLELYEKALIIKKYGADLENPIKTNLSKKESNNFYATVVKKINIILEDENYAPKKRYKLNPSQESLLVFAKENGINNEWPLSIAESNIESYVPLEKSEEDNNEISKNINNSHHILNYYIPEKEDENSENAFDTNNLKGILSLLSTSVFSSLLNNLSFKEVIIILGFIDAKYSNTSEIANFLGIDEEEVLKSRKKALITYKELLKSFKKEQSFSKILTLTDKSHIECNIHNNRVE